MFINTDDAKVVNIVHTIKNKTSTKKENLFDGYLIRNNKYQPRKSFFFPRMTMEIIDVKYAVETTPNI